MKTPRLKTLEKYKKLIEGNVWTKQEINGFRKLIGSMRFCQDADMKAKVSELVNTFSELNKEYKITKEQTQEGLKYLKEKVLLKRGGVAKNSGFHDGHESILKRAKGFRFIGLHALYNDYTGSIRDTAPVYLILTNSKDTLMYAPVHWSPSIVENDISFL